MPTSVDKAATVVAMDDIWHELVALGDTLTQADWNRPSPCPGWSVKDLYSHIVGTESMMLGRGAPEVEVGDADHVRNDIGAFNEQWVATYRDRSGAEVLAALREVIAERRPALAAVTPEAWEEVGFTPAGKDTHGRFMRVRVFDMWAHEQDARQALARPGHLAGPAVDLALDEVAASMGYVVGKLASAPDGAAVRLGITGETERTINVAVDGRASVVDDLGHAPDVTVEIPIDRLVPHIGNRTDSGPDDPALEIHGDGDLGRRIIANLGYTI